MPYDYNSDKSRLNIEAVSWDQGKYEVVTYNPCPHHYGTLNLPTWDKKDWPFLAQVVNLGDTSFNDWDNKWAGGPVDLGYPIRPISQNRLSIRPFTWNSPEKKWEYGKLNYQGNLPHFTHPGKGAFTLHEGRISACRYGFSMGSPDYPSRTRQQSKVYQAQRWMNSVFGVQFEWDSGIEFPNNHVGDHMPPAQLDSHGEVELKGPMGYQVENLWITMGMVSTRGVIIEDFILPLVKDGKICKDIVYWYEGYSLFDPIPWNGLPFVDDNGLGNGEIDKPSQGKEITTPCRRGRCGFAMSSTHANFELVANARIPTQDDYAFLEGGQNIVLPGVPDYHLPYQKRVKRDDDFRAPVNEPDELDPDYIHGEVVKVGANMIMTGMVMTFRAFGASPSEYNTFRMWNWKPITVPVKYMTDKKHITEDANYRPYAAEYQDANAPIVGVDVTKAGCPCPPLLPGPYGELYGMCDPSFEAVVPAIHNAWNQFNLGIEPNGKDSDDWDTWACAELGYHKGQTVSTSNLHQQFYVDMVHENMLTTSWFTKEFADRQPSGGWYLYDTPAHKNLNFRIAGPSIDKGTMNHSDGQYIDSDLSADDDISSGRNDFVGDYGPFPASQTPNGENTKPNPGPQRATNSIYGKYREGGYFESSEADGFVAFASDKGQVERREADTDPRPGHGSDDVFNWPVEPPA